MANLSLEKVISFLPFKDEEVLNVYLMGSRLWGNARPDSDWDFLVVVRNDTQGFVPDLHSPRLNVTILDETTFRHRIKNHAFIETMALHAPRTHVWRERVNVSSPAFDHKLWETAIKYRVDRNLALIRKAERKGNTELIQKTSWYTLCTLVLGKEFAKWASHPRDRASEWDPTLGERCYPKSAALSCKQSEQLQALQVLQAMQAMQAIQAEYYEK